jgi:hypothetical protein
MYQYQAFCWGALEQGILVATVKSSYFIAFVWVVIFNDFNIDSVILVKLVVNFEKVWCPNKHRCVFL